MYLKILFNKEKNLATKSELNYFIDRLIKLLEDSNFFKPDEKKKAMINNIEAIFYQKQLNPSRIENITWNNN